MDASWDMGAANKTSIPARSGSGPTPALAMQAEARRFVDGSSKIKKAPPPAEPFLCLVPGEPG
ncbi:hypothetical protein GWL_45240 [Herbaspirillum sp. GW103]|nr:hypothetical protein GWL_45240 [Herbaspirillum sp. GW103]